MSVKFDDPVIHSVIESMGGWEALCSIENAEMKWKRKEFENLYPIMAKREAHPDRLIGMCDRQNLARGFDEFVNEPKEIGDHILVKKQIEAPKYANERGKYDEPVAYNHYWHPRSVYGRGFS